MAGPYEGDVRDFVEHLAMSLADYGFPRMAARVLVGLMAAEEDSLSAGELEAGVITCGVHRHCFDAGTGQGINPLGSNLVRLPVVVRSANDHEALQLALVENLQREDLNPIEEAAGYRKVETYTYRFVGRETLPTPR